MSRRSRAEINREVLARLDSLQNCPEHGAMSSRGWGCPDCVRALRYRVSHLEKSLAEAKDRAYQEGRRDGIEEAARLADADAARLEGARLIAKDMDWHTGQILSADARNQVQGLAADIRALLDRPAPEESKG